MPLAGLLVLVLFLCLTLHTAAAGKVAGSSLAPASQQRSSRRSLRQAGTARFMSLPILTDEVQEAGPAPQPKQQVKQQPATAPTTPSTPSKQQQQRGLLSTDTRRRTYDRRWRQDRLNRYRRYDRGTLSPLLGSYNRYNTISRQPLPLLTGVLGSLLQPGNPRGTAQSLAKAYSSGQSDAAAQAVASAAAGEGSAQASTVAQGIADMSVNHKTVLPGENKEVLARSY